MDIFSEKSKKNSINLTQEKSEEFFELGFAEFYKNQEQFQNYLFDPFDTIVDAENNSRYVGKSSKLWLKKMVLKRNFSCLANSEKFKIQFENMIQTTNFDKSNKQLFFKTVYSIHTLFLSNNIKGEF